MRTKLLVAAAAASLLLGASAQAQDLSGRWRVNSTTYDNTGLVLLRACDVRINRRGGVRGVCADPFLGEVNVRGRLRLSNDGTGRGSLKLQGYIGCNRVAFAATDNVITGIYTCRRNSGAGELTGVRIR